MGNNQEPSSRNYKDLNMQRYMNQGLNQHQIIQIR